MQSEERSGEAELYKCDRWIFEVIQGLAWVHLEYTTCRKKYPPLNSVSCDAAPLLMCIDESSLLCMYACEHGSPVQHKLESCSKALLDTICPDRYILDMIQDVGGGCILVLGL